MCSGIRAAVKNNPQISAFHELRFCVAQEGEGVFLREENLNACSWLLRSEFSFPTSAWRGFLLKPSLTSTSKFVFMVSYLKYNFHRCIKTSAFVLSVFMSHRENWHSPRKMHLIYSVQALGERRDCFLLFMLSGIWVMFLFIFNSDVSFPSWLPYHFQCDNEIVSTSRYINLFLSAYYMLRKWLNSLDSFAKQEITGLLHFVSNFNAYSRKNC